MRTGVKSKNVQWQILLQNLRRNERPGSFYSAILQSGESFAEREGHVEVGHWVKPSEDLGEYNVVDKQRRGNLRRDREQPSEQ